MARTAVPHYPHLSLYRSDIAALLCPHKSLYRSARIYRFMTLPVPLYYSAHTHLEVSGAEEMATGAPSDRDGFVHELMDYMKVRSVTGRMCVTGRAQVSSYGQCLHNMGGIKLPKENDKGKHRSSHTNSSRGPELDQLPNISVT